MYQSSIDALQKNDLNVLNRIAKLLVSSKNTVSTIESCTGGLLGFFLTTLQGSSEYYIGGVSAYSNETKRRIMNVPDETLEQFGAVSREVARSLAKNGNKLMKTNYSISLTGIAGPDGGTCGLSVVCG